MEWARLEAQAQRLEAIWGKLKFDKLNSQFNHYCILLCSHTTKWFCQSGNRTWGLGHVACLGECPGRAPSRMEEVHSPAESSADFITRRPQKGDNSITHGTVSWVLPFEPSIIKISSPSVLVLLMMMLIVLMILKKTPLMRRSSTVPQQLSPAGSIFMQQCIVVVIKNFSGPISFNQK